jgi:hypothetical protein
LIKLTARIGASFLDFIGGMVLHRHLLGWRWIDTETKHTEGDDGDKQISHGNLQSL